jgi:hypothetical protein
MVLSSDGRDDGVGRSEGRGSRGDTGGAALGSYQLGMREGARDRRKGGGPMDLYELARNCKIRMTTQVRGGVYCCANTWQLIWMLFSACWRPSTSCKEGARLFGCLTRVLWTGFFARMRS